MSLSESRLRVGVIGAGRWSTSAHLPGFARSPLCDLVAVCDLDGDLARARAEQFGAPDYTDDYTTLLSRTDLDVIDIVTRDDHQDLVFADPRGGQALLGREARLP